MAAEFFLVQYIICYVVKSISKCSAVQSISNKEITIVCFNLLDYYYEDYVWS